MQQLIWEAASFLKHTLTTFAPHFLASASKPEALKEILFEQFCKIYDKKAKRMTQSSGYLWLPAENFP